jgi:hypothetical protein
MEPIMAEAADAYLRRLIEGELPWEEKQPLSWPDFLSILEAYCHSRQWEILFDSVSDFSLAIFAREEQVTNGTTLSNESIQQPLPFEEDADDLPF